MNCNQAVAIVRPKPGLSNRFLLHWLGSDNAKSQIRKSKVTATISNLSLSQIGALELQVPPLDEQRRIAAILDAADALRTKRLSVHAKLDDLVRSIFTDMFIVPESKKWPVRTISEISTDIRTGPFGSQLLHSEFVYEGIAVLGIDNAVMNIFRWEQRRFITKEKYQKLKRYTVRPGDV
jgi:type I restriction enzyme, S subunit